MKALSLTTHLHMKHFYKSMSNDWLLPSQNTSLPWTTSSLCSFSAYPFSVSANLFFLISHPLHVGVMQIPFPVTLLQHADLHDLKYHYTCRTHRLIFPTHTFPLNSKMLIELRCPSLLAFLHGISNSMCLKHKLLIPTLQKTLLLQSSLSNWKAISSFQIFRAKHLKSYPWVFSLHLIFNHQKSLFFPLASKYMQERHSSPTLPLPCWSKWHFLLLGLLQ